MTPPLVAAARSLLKGGASRSTAVAHLEADFPSASSREVASVVDAEAASLKRIDTLSRQNTGQFASAWKAFGCGSPGDRVRVGVEISFMDETRGTLKKYGVGVDVRSHGRLKDLLQDVIDAARQSAVNSGYNVPTIAPSMSDGFPSYEITYIDCL